MTDKKQEAAHSRFGGSTADRFVNCPASVSRCEKMPPQEETTFTQEGTMLHAVCEWWLTQYKNNNYHRAGISLKRWDLSAEQENVVMTFVDYVTARLDLWQSRGYGVKLFIEERVRIPDHDDFYGTADVILVAKNREGEVFMDVIDLKAGRGVEVHASHEGHMNRQLGYYGLGAFHSVLTDKLRKGFRAAHLTIVQPRFENPFKTYTASLDDLIYLKIELVKAATLAEGENPPARAGKWCRFCTAKPICEEHREQIQDMAKADFAKEGGKPEELTGKQMAALLSNAQVIEAWIQSVKAYALHTIQYEDLEIPGWEAVPKRAVRKWKDKDWVRDALTTEEPFVEYAEDFCPRTPLSPVQMENMGRKLGINMEEFVELHTVAESSGAKLAHTGEKSEEESK